VPATGGIAGALAIGAAAWTAQTGPLATRLHMGREREAPYSHGDLAWLPDPVARYFGFALTPDRLLERGARLRQTGATALRPDSWSRFTPNAAPNKRFVTGADGPYGDRIR
jgi:hypothetical protein